MSKSNVSILRLYIDGYSIQKQYWMALRGHTLLTIHMQQENLCNRYFGTKMFCLQCKSFLFESSKFIEVDLLGCESVVLSSEFFLI